MPTYFKKTQVEAVQFLPTKSEKDSLTKDPKGEREFSPATVLGGLLKVTRGTKGAKDLYYTSINTGSEEATIEEGDWLVTERTPQKNYIYVVHDADFKKNYSAGVVEKETTPVKKETKKPL